MFGSYGAVFRFFRWLLTCYPYGVNSQESSRNKIFHSIRIQPWIHFCQPTPGTSGARCQQNGPAQNSHPLRRSGTFAAIRELNRRFKQHPDGPLPETKISGSSGAASFFGLQAINMSPLRGKMPARNGNTVTAVPDVNCTRQAKQTGGISPGKPIHSRHQRCQILIDGAISKTFIRSGGAAHFPFSTIFPKSRKQSFPRNPATPCLRVEKPVPLRSGREKFRT